MKISVEEFFTGGARSLVRNPLLVTLFTRMGASERAGSGSQKIIDVVVKNRFKEPELVTNINKTKLKLWIAEPNIDITDMKSDEKEVYLFLNNSNQPFMKYSKQEIAQAHPHIKPARLSRILESLASKKLLVKWGANRNRKYSRSYSSIEMIHHVGTTFDLLKHELYKNK